VPRWGTLVFCYKKGRKIIYEEEIKNMSSAEERRLAKRIEKLETSNAKLEEENKKLKDKIKLFENFKKEGK
jgi:cell division protein FtsB